MPTRLVVCSLVILLACAEWNKAKAQVAGGDPINPGGSVGSTASVVVVATPAKVLPIGSQVTLTANPSNIANPTFSWTGRCQNGPAHTGRPPICGEQLLNWDTQTIKDFEPNPGVYEYIVFVNGTQEATASEAIRFEPPNKANVSCAIKPFLINPGNPTEFNWVQKTTLKWDSTPLGPCAAVCFRENVDLVVQPGYLAFFASLEFHTFNANNNSNQWFPAGCLRTASGDTRPGHEADITMYWQSPVLTDKLRLTFSDLMIRALQNEPLNALIAKRTHRYMFDGSSCNSVAWGPLLVVIEAHLIVAETTLNNGQMIKFPKWKLISTTSTSL